MRPTLIILAGGKGTRLGDITQDIPKPMVDIEGKPFLYWLIKHYANQGFTNINLSLGYKAEMLEQYGWPVPVTGIHDNEEFNGAVEAYKANGSVVVNGDTWINESLPTDTKNPWILSCNDIDAGAQFVAKGKIKIYCTPQFFDIGTPFGLEIFRAYFKTHLAKTLKND